MTAQALGRERSMTAQALGREWRLAASVTLEHQKSGRSRFFDAFLMLF